MITAQFLVRSSFCMMIGLPQLALANEAQLDASDPDKIVIADTFERLKVSASDVEATLRGCIPAVIGGNMQFPLPKGHITITTTNNAPNQFTVIGEQAACIKDTNRGFPLLPIEALSRRATFTGVAISRQNDWFRQIARLIASSGKAELAVANANGGIHVLTYSAPIAERGRLSLGRRFVQSGESRGDVNPQAINVVAPEMSSISLLERRAAAGVEPDAHNPVLAFPVFFDASPSEVDNPRGPLRVERSALTGLPLATKP